MENRTMKLRIRESTNFAELILTLIMNGYKVTAQEIDGTDYVIVTIMEVR